ncbi:MAG: toxin-antitoxin system HicB family antitoxin [Nitrospinaceae bacterium]
MTKKKKTKRTDNPKSIEPSTRQDTGSLMVLQEKGKGTKSMTVRKIDPALASRLKQMAEKEGKSVNQFVIETLEQGVGMKKQKRFTQKHHDLDHLFGRWSEKEYRRIQSQIDGQRKIDRELWK